MKKLALTELKTISGGCIVTRGCGSERDRGCGNQDRDNHGCAPRNSHCS